MFTRTYTTTKKDVALIKETVKLITGCKFRLRNFGGKVRMVFDEKPTLAAYNRIMYFLFGLGYIQIGVKSIEEVEENTFNNTETFLYKVEA